MLTTRNIKRRIKSIANTAKITKAMQMVASSKMRRAQQAALAGRPYAGLLADFVAQVTRHAGDFVHPLTVERPVRRRAIVVIGPDRGLCGALPSNLIREAIKADPAQTVYIAVGRKPAQYLARLGRKLLAEFPVKDSPQFPEARAVSKFACDCFLKGEVDRVDILYTEFVNTLTQRPGMVQFLPAGTLRELGLGIKRPSHTETQPTADLVEFLFEPGPQEIFEALLPHYLNFLMYQIMLEAKASEHSARMVAMKNATENANQLIAEMTLQYNKMRQAAITKELLEISAAQMAME